jgi:hypothetical protein
MIRATKASDEDVIESFRECVNPKGEDPWTLDLLRLGQLAIVIKDMLFVHADVNERSIGYVPPHEMVSNVESDERFATQSVLGSCQEWADALNRWKDEELEDYMKHPGFKKKGDMMARGGLQLIDYCVPGGCNKRTLSHANPFANGNVKLIDPEVEKQLQTWGITRVLSGHQPHGHSPAVARHPQSGLLRIACDTSYSDMSAEKISNRADNRGQVVSIARMQGPITVIEGCLSDGQQHKAVLHNDMSKDELPNALVGRQLKDNAWVKSVIVKKAEKDKPKSDLKDLRDRSFLIVVLGHGFKLESKQLGVVPCCLLLRDDFRTPVPDLFNVRFNQFSGDCFMQQSESTDDLPPDDVLLMKFSKYLSMYAGPTSLSRELSTTSGKRKAPLERNTVFERPELDEFSTYLIAPAGVLSHPTDPLKERSKERL